jgi:hypothetical protein
MSLREIARFTDVVEADLAAAFLASHGIEVSVTERFQTTIDPLMQRALGIRLMAPASLIPEARALLARVQAGEFATSDGDDLPDVAGTRSAGTVLALAVFFLDGFWGTSLPRRFRAFPWQGLLLAIALTGTLFVAVIGGGWLIYNLLINPP